MPAGSRRPTLTGEAVANADSEWLTLSFNAQLAQEQAAVRERIEYLVRYFSGRLTLS